MNDEFNKMDNEINNANEEMYNNMEKVDDNVDDVKDNMNDNMHNIDDNINKNEDDSFNYNMSNEPQQSESVDNNQLQSYPPKKSNNGLIIGVIAAVVLIGGGILAYFLLFSGNESIKCSMSETEDEMVMSANVEMNFKKGYFTNGTMTEKVEFASLTDEQINSLKDMDMCSQIPSGNSEILFSNCKQNISGKTIEVSVDIASGTDTSEKVDVEEGKKMFEQMGFTCK